jgi:hypothetical protein
MSLTLCEQKSHLETIAVVQVDRSALQGLDADVASGIARKDRASH